MENNHSGYQHSNEEAKRPLGRTLICEKCNNYLVGYINKAKGLHYYRCLRCKGVSLSANRRPQNRKKSADELFLEFLQQYQLSGEIVPVIALQLKKIFTHYQQNTSSDEQQLKKQLLTLQTQLKELRLSRGLNKIDEETFSVTKEYLEAEILKTQKELDRGVPQISNLEKLLTSSLEKLQNLSQIWGSTNFENKRVLQKMLFPQGVVYSAEKNQYLTRTCNRFVELTASLSSSYVEIKKATVSTFVDLSPSVARSRLELPTFGL